ncbi:sulfite exporter TauE/SafE family protein [Carboxylicivirga caseinilyticus]|uniref:sulfite exporter TauE/SafE family protein n=1 Tax=Carboxylicivirga caseinilyticus TaxID=3417572 RepID=UPI003D354707|nr:sulfite exporter TauE/SafE family protein [Marinilabiliaceae bacterium A049]
MLNVGGFLVIILASLVKGITGFGFALVSLPLLMIWYSPKELIPILMICNLISSILIVLQKKEKKLVNKQFKTLIIYGGVFTILGVITLKLISEGFLVKLLGVFFILLSIITLINRSVTLNISKKWYKLAGAFIGYLTGSISVSGPPLALFLNMANVSNQEFREIFSWFNIVSATIAIIGYYHLGMISNQMLITSLYVTPILLLGTVIGKRLNQILPASLFKKISLYITLLVSIFLLIK